MRACALVSSPAHGATASEHPVSAVPRYYPCPATGHRRTPGEGGRRDQILDARCASGVFRRRLRCGRARRGCAAGEGRSCRRQAAESSLRHPAAVLALLVVASRVMADLARAGGVGCLPIPSRRRGRWGRELWVGACSSHRNWLRWVELRAKLRESKGSAFEQWLQVHDWRRKQGARQMCTISNPFKRRRNTWKSVCSIATIMC
eukprot:gene14011-biopygen12545